MADRSKDPGNPQGLPIESRRTAAATEVGGVTPDETVTDDGEASVIDEPEMGEFSAESARPTPLDDIAAAERSKLPSD